MFQPKLLALFFTTFLTACVAQGYIKANSHNCVLAVRGVSKRGEGDTIESCMSCDPALPECADGCQKKIDKMYYSCDGVCLPDGYYFDPKQQFDGCWEDVKPDIKIQVERCGCDAGYKLLLSPFLLVLSVVTAAVVFIC